MPTLRSNRPEENGKRRKRNGQDQDQERAAPRRPPRIMFGSGMLDRARRAMQGRTRVIDDEVQKAGG